MIASAKSRKQLLALTKKESHLHKQPLLAKVLYKGFIILFAVANFYHPQQQQHSSFDSFAIRRFETNNYVPHQQQQHQRTFETRSGALMFADAKMLGKMAKVWYLKKKVKKFAKKLKKHTIAVPVITAIPIYEHSYYPHPSMLHGSHHGHHHLAASNQVATIAEPMASAQSIMPTTHAAPQNNYQSQYQHHRHNQVPQHHNSAHNSHNGHHNHHNQQHNQKSQQQQYSNNYAQHLAAAAAMYGRGHIAAVPVGDPNQIINSYVPSPPMYIDNTGGLYGAYNNAYGINYNGAYHVW